MTNQNTAEQADPRDGRRERPGRQAEEDIKEHLTKEMAAHIRIVVEGEQDHSVRLSGLVLALANEIVEYAHTGDKLVLDDVIRIRDEVHERITPAITVQTLDRIAKDPKTVGVFCDNRDNLLTLVQVLRARPPSRRTDDEESMPAGLAAMLASILRGKTA